MATAPVSCSPSALVHRFRTALPARARVYVPGVAAEPYALGQAFQDAPGLADGLTFFGVWIPGVNRTDWSALSPDCRFETLFLGPELRAGFEAGRVTFLPFTYTRAWRWLETTPVDGAMVQVAPPDGEGNCSLSLSCDFTPAICARARVKVAQINPKLPAMPGAPSIPLSAFDAVTELAGEPRGYDAGALPAAFERIADHIAARVEDGAAVQFGLGKVQLAVLPKLKPRRNLTLHSGMVSEPLLELLDGDTLAAIRTGAVLGSARLAEALKDDRRLCMTPVNRTHALQVLSGLANFTAINSVIDVDLFGQANAEFVGGRQVSGGGGLVDFARGAQGSPGGQTIIALASTARNGSVSRIVPRLSPDAITLSRADVEVVVTEHGVADLRGLSLDARAQALIDIADPEHRPMLERSWSDMRSRL